MLDVTLKFLKGELDAYLLARTGSNAVGVKLSKVVDELGKYLVDEDSLCAAMINVEEERVMKTHLPERTSLNGKHVVLEPSVRLNLYILFAAHFKQYDQALKYLSYVLTYFQSHPLFTASVYPALDVRIGRLTAELQSLSYEHWNQIWAFVGGKQLPAAVYKIGILFLQDVAPAGIETPITRLEANLHSQ